MYIRCLFKILILMKHLRLTFFCLLVIITTIWAQSNEESDESGESEPATSGAVTVLSGDVSIEKVTRWDDGAPKGVDFLGSVRVEITIPRETVEDSDASIAYYTLDVRPSLHTAPEERFLVEVGGVVIGLQNFSNAQNIPTGEVTYKVPGGAGLFEKASVYFPLEDNHTPPISVRLTVSLDQGSGTWDLYLGGERWLTALTYTPGEEKIVLESRSDLRTKVRNMNISSINPFEGG